jgi:hypothetical protein
VLILLHGRSLWKRALVESNIKKEQLFRCQQRSTRTNQHNAGAAAAAALTSSEGRARRVLDLAVVVVGAQGFGVFAAVGLTRHSMVWPSSREHISFVERAEAPYEPATHREISTFWRHGIASSE